MLCNVLSLQYLYHFFGIKLLRNTFVHVIRCTSMLSCFLLFVIINNYAHIIVNKIAHNFFVSVCEVCTLKLFHFGS